MKYYSDNKTVEKELNKTWVRVGIPFIIIFFGLVLTGFYLMIKLDLNGNIYAPLTILLAIIISGFIGYKLSILWFKSALDYVDDKTELTERAIRHLMILESTARKILTTKNITLKERSENNGKLRESRIHKKIKLTSDYIDINKEITFWDEIKDFRILTDSRQNYNADHTVILILNGDAVKRYRIQLTNARKIEYEIDKYLNARRKKKYLP
jgi:hypothetical protein